VQPWLGQRMPKLSKTIDKKTGGMAPHRGPKFLPKKKGQGKANDSMNAPTHWPTKAKKRGGKRHATSKKEGWKRIKKWKGYRKIKNVDRPVGGVIREKTESTCSRKIGKERKHG